MASRISVRPGEKLCQDRLLFGRTVAETRGEDGIVAHPIRGEALDSGHGPEEPPQRGEVTPAIARDDQHVIVLWRERIKKAQLAAPEPAWPCYEGRDQDRASTFAQRHDEEACAMDRALALPAAP
jgi:hypothetical protein